MFEVIEAVKKQTGRTFAVECTERRTGDPAILVGSAEKARRVLNWQPAYPNIETIVKHAWAWYCFLQQMQK